MEGHQLKMWQKDGECLGLQSIAIWNVSKSDCKEKNSITKTTRKYWRAGHAIARNNSKKSKM